MLFHSIQVGFLEAKSRGYDIFIMKCTNTEIFFNKKALLFGVNQRAGLRRFLCIREVIFYFSWCAMSACARAWVRVRF